MRVQDLNIATKFNFLTIMLIVLTSAGIASFLTYRAINERYDGLLSSGKSFAQVLAGSSEYALYTQDSLALEQIVNSIDANEDIAYLFIISKEMQVLAYKSKISSIQAPPQTHSLNTSDKLKSREFIHNDDGTRYIDVQVPVVSLIKDGMGELFLDDIKSTDTETETIGYLHLGYSLAGLSEYTNQLIYSTVFFASLLIIVGILLTLSMTKRITNPISRVIEVSSSIAQGDFNNKLEVTSRDEVGKLSSAFNEMSSKLYKSIGELERSEEKYHNLIEFADVGIIVSEKNRIIQVNKRAQEIYDYSKDELIGQSPGILTLEKYRERHKNMLDEIVKYENARERVFEEEGVKKDGSIFPIEISYSLSNSTEKDDYSIIAIMRDITDRKKAEEHINASLKEKELLLKEIHHRVKNNMQVISSLLKLQSGYVKDESDLELFKESQHRIKAMALIHEKLYQSKDLVNIDFPEYVKNLANSLIRSYGSGLQRIGLKTEIANVSLGVDAAIPCGLIINELVSNALKYAFPEGKEGEIRIIMHPANGDGIELIVGDDGIGVPVDFNFRATESLGLQLVTSLSEGQLHGTVELNRNGGTEFKISFKDVKYKERV